MMVFSKSAKAVSSSFKALWNSAEIMAKTVILLLIFAVSELGISIFMIPKVKTKLSASGWILIQTAILVWMWKLPTITSFYSSSPETNEWISYFVAIGFGVIIGLHNRKYYRAIFSRKKEEEIV